MSEQEPTLEEAVEELVSVIEYVLRRNEVFIGRGELTRILLEVYEFIPDNDDPRSMGWVGDDGRP